MASAGEPIASTAAARSAGSLLVFSGVMAGIFASSAGQAGGCGSAALAGVAIFFLPWARWPRSAPLFLLPFGLAVLATGNYVKADPYVAGVFFVVIAMWVGL